MLNLPRTPRRRSLTARRMASRNELQELRSRTEDDGTISTDEVLGVDFAGEILSAGVHLLTLSLKRWYRDGCAVNLTAWSNDYAALSRYVVHRPFRKQLRVPSLKNFEAFYGGLRVLESDAMLTAAAQYMDVPGYAALIVRRTFNRGESPRRALDRAKNGGPRLAAAMMRAPTSSLRQRAPRSPSDFSRARKRSAAMTRRLH